MKYQLVVRPEVEADLLKAEAWYEQQQAGLGREFLLAARDAMSLLQQNALLYRLRHRRKAVRWAYPRRFPYRIVFSVRQETVVIYAVLHAARHDQEWRRRT